MVVCKRTLFFIQIKKNNKSAKLSINNHYCNFKIIKGVIIWLNVSQLSILLITKSLIYGLNNLEYLVMRVLLNNFNVKMGKRRAPNTSSAHWGGVGEGE